MFSCHEAQAWLPIRATWELYKNATSNPTRRLAFSGVGWSPEILIIQSAQVTLIGGQG